jgi:hypothetical protein
MPSARSARKLIFAVLACERIVARAANERIVTVAVVDDIVAAGLFFPDESKEAFEAKKTRRRFA